MQKVTTVNLAGRAFNLDEGAFDTLRVYLDQADAKMQGNPDRVEILNDLEMAIADKCAARLLHAQATVITVAHVTDIVKQMGPVDGDDTPAAAPAATPAGAGAAAAETSTSPIRRLHRVREGAIISGICNGFAAYFGLDAVLIRIAAVILTFVTGGGLILLYLVLIFAIPAAKTDEQRAAAHGKPFNARTVAERVKQQCADASATLKEESAIMRERWQNPLS
jgi:phage shock protein PspC (stress-responsive transcriptional regulator)